MLKKTCLVILMVILGILGFISGLCLISSIACLQFDLIIFWAIFTAMFVLPTLKLRKVVKSIKIEPKPVKEKPVKPIVKPEPVKPIVKEEPVNNVIQFKQKENKEEPKEEKQPESKTEKQPESKEEMSIGKAILTLIGVGLAFLGIGAVIVGIIALIGYVGFYVISFILNALMYIGGFLIAGVLIGGFIKFWWSLVIHEHVDKPRGIIRVKVKNRRW